MDNRFYRPELDIVRLIALLCVFVHHSSSRTVNTRMGVFEDAAGYGLPLFLVLSAYLITTLLLREKQRTGTIAIARFYERRMLRIWPLYFAALASGALFYLFQGQFHSRWRWYLAACFMLGNTHLISQNLYAHLWSISIEEQFYLIWPGLVRKLNPRRLVYAPVLVISIANVVLIHYGRAHAVSDYSMWFNSFVQFEMFAAGILLAIVAFDQATWLSSQRLRVILIASVFVILIVTERFCHIKTPGYRSTGPLSLCLGYGLIALCCAVFTYAMLGSKGWPRWLVHMGKVSYGLYVFHWPVLILMRHVAPNTQTSVRGTVALLLTSILALLSYRFFETPFLKMKQRLEIIPSRPVEVD